VDLISHILLTRLLVGKEASTLAASIAPDLPWHLTYLPYVIARGEAGRALRNSEWPTSPAWMESLHHATHSLVVLAVGTAFWRLIAGRWPRKETAAWGLHILVDIPTHARHLWGPRFLWPLSDLAIDGVPWAVIASQWLSKVLSWAKRDIPPAGVRRRGRSIG